MSSTAPTDIASPLSATPATGVPLQDALTAPQRSESRSRTVGQVLVERGAVTPDRLEEAVELARERRTTPERVLLDAGTVSEEQVSRALAERHGLDHLDLAHIDPDPAALNLLPPAVARRYTAIPVAFLGDRRLLVALADPANVLAADDIALMTGYEIAVAVATRSDVLARVQQLTRLDEIVQTAIDEDFGVDEAQDEVVQVGDGDADGPVITLVNQVLGQAIERGASDVHLTPAADEMRVRFRIDGVLRDTTTVPRRMVPGVISRVKVMAELDIAERRVPQDGRVALSLGGHRVDLRVVTLPSVHGEAVIMRVLDRDEVVIDLASIGMAPEDRETFRRGFSRAHGAVLVTGPTGSGKSTSLYAALQQINSRERHIITIEDPVERQLEGVTQVQVHNKAGLGFAKGLRSMMRADPDVIMVGEIRDSETAQIAVESALTGHLVLSTLHTNDAPSAVTRLVEMGIEPFLVASALETVVAQRLCRLLCTHCRRATVLSREVMAENGFRVEQDLEAYEAVGCSRCGMSGYRGRIGLYEVMSVSDEIRELTIERASADRIARAAEASGMRRLRDDGLQKVREGRTSIAEVARVTGSVALEA